MKRNIRERMLFIWIVLMTSMIAIIQKIDSQIESLNKILDLYRRHSSIALAVETVKNEFLEEIHAEGWFGFDDFTQLTEGYRKHCANVLMFQSFHEELLDPCSENNASLRQSFADKIDDCRVLNVCRSNTPNCGFSETMKRYTIPLKDEAKYQSKPSDKEKCVPSSLSKRYKEIYESKYREQEDPKMSPEEMKMSPEEMKEILRREGGIKTEIGAGITTTMLLISAKLAKDQLRKKYRDKLKELKDRRAGNSF